MVIIDDQSPSPLDQCGQLHQILNEELKKESPTGFLIQYKWFYKLFYIEVFHESRKIYYCYNSTNFIFVCIYLL